MHTSFFRVRHYECDAYGHLNNVNYVRYLQEAGLQASAAAGYDLTCLMDMRCRWQTRRLQIDYLRPVRYGDEVEVSTCVEAHAAAALRWSYEFRLAGDPDPVARAQAESALVDGRSMVPVEVVAGLALALCPDEGAPPTRVAALEPLPPQPAPPPGIFAIRRRVIWSDLDMTQQVSDATLLAYTEACGMEVLAAHGWPAPRMVAEGFAVILRRHQVEYYEPPQLGDELEIATWASQVRAASALRHFTIRRVAGGALLACADTVGVWVDLANGRPIRIPSGFMDDFAPNLVP